MKKYSFIAILIVAVLLISCRDKALDPIFFTLEQEETLTDDRGLEDTISVFRVVGDGSNYFAAANLVYYRPLGAGAVWKKTSMPANAFCNTLAYSNATGLYVAGFYNKSSGAGMGLYSSADPSVTPWAADGGGPVTSSDQITLIKEVGDVPNTLFVATATINGGGTAYEYSLYYTTDLSAFTQVTFDAATELPVPIVDVAFDDFNNEYYVVAGTSVYNDELGALPAVTTLAGSSATEPFQGLYFAPNAGTNGLIYVASKDGVLQTFDVDVPRTWSTAESYSEDGDPVPFTEFLDIDSANGTSDIFVGSEGFGYYRLVGGAIDNGARSPDYNISNLYNGVIWSFYKTAPGATSGTIFIGTIGAGLWRAVWGTTDWVWKQE